MLSLKSRGTVFKINSNLVTKKPNKQKIVPGRDFPGNSVFQSSPSNVGGQGILGQGTKILHASLPESQKKIEAIL